MTRHITTASNDAASTREALRRRRGRYRHRRRVASPRSIWADVGSTPTTDIPSAAARRATCPSPHPTSSTRRGTGEVALDQREDLLLVLGVGTVGELVLPPAGVPLPERIGHRSSCLLCWACEVERRHRVPSDTATTPATRGDLLDARHADASIHDDALPGDHERPPGLAPRTRWTRRSCARCRSLRARRSGRSRSRRRGRRSTPGDRGTRRWRRRGSRGHSRGCPRFPHAGPHSQWSDLVRTAAPTRRAGSPTVATICAARTTTSTAGSPALQRRRRRADHRPVGRRRATRRPRTTGGTPLRSAPRSGSTTTIEKHQVADRAHDPQTRTPWRRDASTSATTTTSSEGHDRLQPHVPKGDGRARSCSSGPTPIGTGTRPRQVPPSAPAMRSGSTYALEEFGIPSEKLWKSAGRDARQSGETRPADGNECAHDLPARPRHRSRHAPTTTADAEHQSQSTPRALRRQARPGQQDQRQRRARPPRTRARPSHASATSKSTTPSPYGTRDHRVLEGDEVAGHERDRAPAPGRANGTGRSRRRRRRSATRAPASPAGRR